MTAAVKREAEKLRALIQQEVAELRGQIRKLEKRPDVQEVGVALQPLLMDILGALAERGIRLKELEVGASTYSALLAAASRYDGLGLLGSWEAASLPPTVLTFAAPGAGVLRILLRAPKHMGERA